MQYSEIITFKI